MIWRGNAEVGCCRGWAEVGGEFLRDESVKAGDIGL